MAVYGILGDIHGNREGLVAVLNAFRQRGVTRLLCVGDIVGFNADSDECVSLIRSQDARVIAGNHDLIATGRLGFDKCSNKARYSLKQTRRRLAPSSIAWLHTLPDALLIDDEVALVHGGVHDVQLYMTTAHHIRQNLPLLLDDFPTARLCFFGHSHEQRIYEVVGEEVRTLPPRTTQLQRDRLYFVNPGSIDAQRKRDDRLAQYAIFDSDTWTLELLSTPYDSAATEHKAIAAGYRIGPLTDRWYTLRRRIAAAWSRLLRSAGSGVN